MKKLYLILTGIIFIFCSSNLSAQDFDLSFVKSFNKSFRAPQIFRDSSLNQITLLRIHFDKNLNVTEISFSDNALEDTKKALKDITDNLETESLKVYLKKKKLANISFVYPVAIYNVASYYISPVVYPAYQTFSSFSGKTLTEPCILRNAIIWVLYPPIH